MSGCACLPCRRRAEAGLAPFEGTSNFADMHIVDEPSRAPPPARAKAPVVAPPPAPIFTDQQLDVLSIAISKVAAEAAREALDAAACYANALEAQINRLTAAAASDRRRIAALEARPTLKYCGVWAPDRTYPEGSFITDAGCVWAALRTTQDRPPGNGWQLAVRRGQNGRDFDGRRSDRD